MDVRCYAFVVARALVAEIDKLCKTSPNGELQTNDMLNFFTASGNVSGSRNLNCHCISGNDIIIIIIIELLV